MSKSGASWRGFANSIEGYDAPMLLLISHKYKTTIGADDQVGLIGAYIPTRLGDYSEYQGTHETSIFSITPKVRFLPAWKGKGGENYVYFNARANNKADKKAGLGFGGYGKKEFRLWLDEDIIAGSSTEYTDKTFPSGNINDGFQSNLYISNVELWGLGGEEAVIAQQNYWKMKDKAKKTEADMMKKELVGNEFNREMLFGDTFKHQGEIDKR